MLLICRGRVTFCSSWMIGLKVIDYGLPAWICFIRRMSNQSSKIFIYSIGQETQAKKSGVLLWGVLSAFFWATSFMKMAHGMTLKHFGLSKRASRILCLHLSAEMTYTLYILLRFTISGSYLPIFADLHTIRPAKWGEDKRGVQYRCSFSTPGLN